MVRRAAKHGAALLTLILGVQKAAEAAHENAAEAKPAPWVPAGSRDLAVSAALWTSVWFFLFYFFCLTRGMWMSGILPSSKEIEKSRVWCARSLVGTMNSILVAALAVPAFVVISNAPQEVRFPSKLLDVDQCKLSASTFPESSTLDFNMWDLAMRSVSLSGLLFTTFTFADTIISSVHGLGMSLDYIVHHVAFVMAGVLIRSHCLIPYNSSILLSMEVSTPFLNYMLFFRHRGDRYRVSVYASGAIFFVLFLCVRIALNAYGVFVLISSYDVALPPEIVPRWQAIASVVSVTTGTLVQFFWFPRIAKKAIGIICGLRGGGAEGVDPPEARPIREVELSQLWQGKLIP
eukprot:TRINITY_DN26527_c0_g2_i1.p1 TRINITY_DN26527_c0_g2~~TRINITY_DN26527_c0_g2_i1.p1  ORF type:complete len:348 (-),score=49.52 TRINITY_DN26527_c0_g2_i1:67-1110(-)